MARINNKLQQRDIKQNFGRRSLSREEVDKFWEREYIDQIKSIKLIKMPEDDPIILNDLQIFELFGRFEKRFGKFQNNA